MGTDNRLKNARQRADELFYTLTEKSAKALKLEHSLKNSEEELCKCKQEISTLQSTLSSKDQELHECKQEISKLQVTRISALSSETPIEEHDLQNEHQILNEALEARIGELSEELKTAVDKIRNLEQEAQDLHKQLESANSKIQEDDKEDFSTTPSPKIRNVEDNKLIEMVNHSDSIKALERKLGELSEKVNNKKFIDEGTQKEIYMKVKYEKKCEEFKEKNQELSECKQKIVQLKARLHRIQELSKPLV
eukprot:GHVP01011651.1.p1 GENE.GHVP01011651.1~~GHVP01011651.1.p1  ORF type:complete len:250 (-),score=56.06 GHVP01011651.1:160-909(-)